MAGATSRTGEKDFYVYYHHSGGLLAVLEMPRVEEDFPEDPALGILEALVRSDPTDYLYLRLLGDLYTKTGRIREGLRVDLALTTLYPHDPGVFYNLACSWSLLGEREKALAALEEAVRLGWRDARFARQDPDLENLRSDPRFRRLLELMEGEPAGG